MGMTTFFLRLNDCAKPLHRMGKKELKKLDSFSSCGEAQHHAGWHVPFELHNGNVYALVLWKGRLMKIEDAPKVLNRKYYDKYRGKEINEYEWTVLRKYIFAELQRLDKEFKKSLQKDPVFLSNDKKRITAKSHESVKRGGSGSSIGT